MFITFVYTSRINQLIVFHIYTSLCKYGGNYKTTAHVVAALG